MSDAPAGLPPPADPRACIAVDLGAGSCRVSLLRWIDGRPALQLVHRFANAPMRAADATLRWPLDDILSGVEAGIRSAAVLAPEGIRSLAVDGWAVDYVRLDPAGRPLEAPFCYRDERTTAAAAALHRRIPPERLRALTGIELQPLNTLYQLYADHLAGRPSAPWLNLPEFCLARWGAPRVAEYTNASHTGLVDLRTRDWSEEIFAAAGLDLACAPRIVPSGTRLGKLSGPLASVPGLGDTQLIAPACHDTASAIAAIPESGDDWAYISCGTWSLVGTLLDQPLNGPAVRDDNFTNLGAAGGAICFHKSVNGLWLLQQCMEHWAQPGESKAQRGPAWTLPDLLAAAAAESAPTHLLRVDDPSLLGLGDMPARINAQRAADGLPALPDSPDAAPRLVRLLLESLAARYADVLARVRLHTGKPLRRVVVVGGGAQNALLLRLTAAATGLEVIPGTVESSTLGNLAVQLAALENPASLPPARLRPSIASWARQLHPPTMLPNSASLSTSAFSP